MTIRWYLNKLADESEAKGRANRNAELWEAAYMTYGTEVAHAIWKAAPPLKLDSVTP